MTKLYTESLVCFVCEHEDHYSSLASTSAFGSADLDMRPAEPERSSIQYLMQRCAECGYCAPDIEEGIAKINCLSVVRSGMYSFRLQDPSCPELANSFLCRALLEIEAENNLQAAWSLIHAAWVCDDAGLDRQAALWRTDAATFINRTLRSGQEFTAQKGAETAIQVDLLRRAGRPKDAQDLIDTRGPSFSDPMIQQILTFQAGLIARQDRGCYRVEDALDVAAQAALS